mgnify:CR=1 FL=1
MVTPVVNSNSNFTARSQLVQVKLTFALHLEPKSIILLKLRPISQLPSFELVKIVSHFVTLIAVFKPQTTESQIHSSILLAQ